MKDFIGHTTCVQCGKMIEIRVEAGLQASLVLAIFNEDYGNKCKTCLEKAKQKGGKQ